jgi:hypothetical protein
MTLSILYPVRVELTHEAFPITHPMSPRCLESFETPAAMQE